MICTGRGDTDGGHCCWVRGELCEFLFTDRGGTPRCKLHDQWPNLLFLAEWVNAPIGQAFAEDNPGYTCADYPQNIPNLKGGRCCWNEVTLGNVG